MTGLPASLRRSTTAAAFVVAMVLATLPAPTLAANNDLLNDQVTPSSGTAATAFTFQVDYLGVQANSVSVRLTGAQSGLLTVPLSLMTGTNTDGTYGVTTTLAADTWTVSFRADASSQNDPVENWGTLVVSPVPTPTPVPTPVPTATPTPPPTPRPTATPRPAATPTLPPGATPRPPGATPQAEAPPGPGGTPVPGPAGASVMPTATEGTLAGNPTPVSSGGGGNTPASGSGDPNVEETSDTDNAAGVGQAVLLAIGGTLAVSGAGYLAVLAVRRRGRVNEDSA